MTFDEQIVTMFEIREGCVKGETGVLPPPSSCSEFVHGMYLVSQWHLVTILIVTLFVSLMWMLTAAALDRGGH